ncbi:hypothetical protein AKO1_012082, partial [Acrasis kona]
MRVRATQQSFYKRETLLTNLLVFIQPTNPPTKDETILLSAHFDSALYSPGASDDGTGVAVLLEVLRNFCSTDGLPENSRSVLILINDGEEAGLLGSEMLSQHEWADNVTKFINIDSTGSHG